MLTVQQVSAADGADALLQQFEQATTDSERLRCANAFFDCLFSDGFIDEPCRFGAGVPSDSVRQQVYYWAGELLYDRQNYQLSASYCRRALPLYNGDAAADCLSLLALNYVRMGDHTQAADYARQCYELDLKSGDADRISSSLNTLANIYFSANLPREAEPYVLKGIEYCQQAGNQPRLAVLYGTASDVYHALDEQQKALDYAQRALDIDRELGNADRVAVRQTQMAAALVGLERLDEALQQLEQAIPVLQSSGNYHSLAIACNKMGETLNHSGRHAEAATYYGKALAIFQAMGDVYNEMHTHLGIYKSLISTEPDSAQKHFYRYTTLKDSLYSSSAAKSMGHLSAQLNNAELKAENEKQRTRTRTYIILSGVLLMLALITIVLWLRQRRLTRRFLDSFNANNNATTEIPGDDDTSKNDTAAPVPEGNTAIADPTSDTDNEFLSQVNSIIDHQITEGRIDVAEMARQMCMSITTFRRRFTAIVNETPQAYIIRQRMEKARRLLTEHPEMKIQDVGMMCGFDDKSNFTRAFRNTFGMTPSEYVSR